MNKISRVFEGLWFLMMIGISMALSFLWMVVRIPVRLIVCSIRGHEWIWLGNGFFGMFAPTKNFMCEKCGFKTAKPQNYKSVKR